MSEQPTDQRLVPGAPDIPGLTFRPFRDDDDFSRMAHVINQCKAVDGIERVASGEAIERFYRHQPRWQQDRDVIYAEIAGELVAYGAVLWQPPEDNLQSFWQIGFVLPEWRRRGLGRAILRWNEQRLREIGLSQRPGVHQVFEATAADTEHGRKALFQAEGYQPVRYSNRMVCEFDTELPTYALPDGFLVRPIQPQHYDAILAATNEAFRDHWGNMTLEPQQFQGWLKHPDFDPTLWHVAWDGEEIAGVVMSEINRAENLEYRRMRGYIATVAVRRPWRGRGLARALMSRGMHALRARGMSAAMLDVDSENPTGALHLYESLGFHVIKQIATYHKPLA